VFWESTIYAKYTRTKNQKVSPYLIALICDIMNKTYLLSLFLKNARKLLNLTQVIAPEKVCASVEQNQIDVY
jgi:hypothetical protein